MCSPIVSFLACSKTSHSRSDEIKDLKLNPLNIHNKEKAITITNNPKKTTLFVFLNNAKNFLRSRHKKIIDIKNAIITITIETS